MCGAAGTPTSEHVVNPASGTVPATRTEVQIERGGLASRTALDRRDAASPDRDHPRHRRAFRSLRRARIRSGPGRLHRGGARLAGTRRLARLARRRQVVDLAARPDRARDLHRNARRPGPAREPRPVCCSVTAWAACWRSTTRSRTRARWSAWSLRRRRCGARCRRGGSSRSPTSRARPRRRSGSLTGIDEGGISRDAEVVRARDADPLVHGKISPRLYHEFNEARQRALRDAAAARGARARDARHRRPRRPHRGIARVPPPPPRPS